MDDNDKPVLYGVSHLDGVTPVRVQLNPATRAIKVDKVTTIAFNPATITASVNSNDYPLAKAVSSTDGVTILPWVVNASTGAVLITTT